MPGRRKPYRRPRDFFAAADGFPERFFQYGYDLLQRNNCLIKYSRVKIKTDLTEIIFSFAACSALLDAVQSDRDIGPNDINAEMISNLDHLEQMFIFVIMPDRSPAFLLDFLWYALRHKR